MPILEAIAGDLTSAPLKALELDDDTEDIVSQALNQVTEIIIEDSILVAVAVANCESEVGM